MLFIGIDNGLDGGICALGPCAGTAPIAVKRMPTCIVDGRREIDAVVLSVKLRQIATFADPDVSCFVETCPHHSRDKASMRSMALSYGIILGVLADMATRYEWRVHRVHAGNLKDGWQRAMLGDVPRGRTKEYALAAAKSIWPDESFILPGCRTPHDGCVDAALIAEFGRRKGIE